jgi:hypothetical protein
LARPNGRRIAAGTAANDHYVIFHFRLKFSSALGAQCETLPLKSTYD